MMINKTKEKILKKQKAREEKIQQKEKMGIVKRIPYQEKAKKKSLPNRISNLITVEDEFEERQMIIDNAISVYKKFLPRLLKNLKKLEDPRSPKKIKHKMDVLMVYGIVLFIYKTKSRRDANRTISRPIFYENLKMIFPQIISIPHADTLKRVLENIEVEVIEESYIGLLKELIKSKKFKNYLINKRYLIAIDGTQKFFRNGKWCEEVLHRKVGKNETKHEQYYVYVLESVLVLDNGIVLPLMTEFLENKDYYKLETVSEDERKQDCETKAYIRLSERLKKIFRRMPITVVLDGIYANGPVIRACREKNWDFMINLKDKSLKTVWKEANALMRINPENRYETIWGDRKQVYCWANDIDYRFGENNRFKEILNIVVCNETWEETRKDGTKEKMKTKYAWVSNRKINENNVFVRCTKIARYRWKIENHFLVEKNHGYKYTHCFSYTWKAMVGYHYLMKIGHFFNIMVTNCEWLYHKVEELGINGFLDLLKLAVSGSLLDKDRIIAAHKRNRQFRLKYE